MSATAAVPAAVDAAAARVSSMSYADLYGAADDTGPSSAVAGSFGYVAATEAVGQNQAPQASTAATEGGIGSLVELGHELLDTPWGLAFVLGGALLLLLWSDLA